MAPIERVKLVLQTQDLNPRIRRGEIPPYKGELSHHARVFLSLRTQYDLIVLNCVWYRQ